MPKYDEFDLDLQNEKSINDSNVDFKVNGSDAYPTLCCPTSTQAPYC